MKNKIAYGFISFLCFFSILSAQTDVALANDYLNKGKNELFYNKEDEAIQSLKKALELFQSSKNQIKITEIYNILSKAYYP